MRESRLRSATLRLPLGLRQGGSSAWTRRAVASGLVATAIAVAVGPWAAPLRAFSAIALVALAAAAHRALGRRGRPADGWLVVDDEGVRRLGRSGLASESKLLRWHEPFGAVVFASADRATLLLALTTPRSARYVAARVTDAKDAASAPTVIALATTAAESDLRTGDGASLTAADAERLLCEIARRAPAALDRAYLSDASGEAVVLERTELRVGARRIDLSLPLEWRASIFQERGAQTASVCQATWVRQGDVEVVLVAPIPGDGGWLRDAHVTLRAAGEGRAVQRALARDVRLMQAAAGDPPPRELRRAIDRLFMLPLRRALDGAPRSESVRGTRRRSPRASHP
jgi:hypothetical protein